ncbi:unnamed protein product [Blepharisma stoltei]|uniref:Cycloidea-like protein n=1 Tax=Blepharisma stoltei TaxID=1481888 RepID=A0AAU9IH16_9CILI|nr:unnamed protein product [Blepharisma stoltei]
MVKNGYQNKKSGTKNTRHSSDEICESESKENNENQAASSGLDSQQSENNQSQGEEEDRRLLAFKNTAVGCVMYFLRKHSPAPIEKIIEFVKSKEDSLVNSKKHKYKKSAFEIVDYALTWYPKLFLLNDRFHYYLNEKEAEKHEKKYKSMENANSGKRKLKYKEKAEKRRENIEKMNRIRTQIEDDLRSGTAEPSLLTKTYKVLTSGDQKAAEDLKSVIRSAYLEFRGLSP